MKPNKIIYIHQRPFPHERYAFYPEDSDYYFLFGYGALLIPKLPPVLNVQYEIWRGEVGVTKQKMRVVNGVTCRVFPGKEFLIPGSTYSRELLDALEAESRTSNIIIHNSQSPHQKEFYLTISRFRHLPLVVSHMGGPNPLWRFRHQGKYPSLLSYLRERRLFKYVDAFNILVEEEIKYLSEIAGKDKLLLVYPQGIDKQEMQPVPRAEARERLGLSVQKKILLVAGALNDYRGIRENVALFNRLKTSYDVELVSVGAHETDDDYAFARENGVTIFPRVERSELKYFFSAADAYLYLINGAEHKEFAGVGIAPLECLACNTPVIGNTLKHIPDNEWKKVGFMVTSVQEAYDACVTLFGNPGCISETRWLIDKHFSWPVIAQKYVELYDGLFKKYYNTVISPA